MAKNETVLGSLHQCLRKKFTIDRRKKPLTLIYHVLLSVPTHPALSQGGIYVLLFFGGFRCGVLLCFVILVRYKVIRFFQL